MGYIAIWAMLHPDQIPQADERLSFWQKIHQSRHLIPVVLLIVVVLGTIYTGFATATEAAAVGVVGALILYGVQGSLSRSEEHTSELQSLMRISYAVFCLKKKKKQK